MPGWFTRTRDLFLIWMGSWFRKEPRFDVYSPSERCIYQYLDGEKLVRCDPLVLFRRVMDKGPELHSDIVAANVAQSKFADKAYANLQKNIREIFQVKVYDPVTNTGLTEAEISNLFDHFMWFVEVNKKKANLPSTSATATSPTTEPSSTESPATPNTSDSGSVGNESSTKEPPASPSALV